MHTSSPSSPAAYGPWIPMGFALFGGPAAAVPFLYNDARVSGVNPNLGTLVMLLFTLLFWVSAPTGLWPVMWAMGCCLVALVHNIQSRVASHTPEQQTGLKVEHVSLAVVMIPINAFALLVATVAGFILYMFLSALMVVGNLVYAIAMSAASA